VTGVQTCALPIWIVQLEEASELALADTVRLEAERRRLQAKEIELLQQTENYSRKLTVLQQSRSLKLGRALLAPVRMLRRLFIPR
jgi:hypothetical protein